MAITFENFDCNIFGDFKVGDNTVYNADLLCQLIEAVVSRSWWKFEGGVISG